MKNLYLLLKVATVTIWGPLWLLKKGARPLIVLIAGALIAGCASPSNKFDKSPCACQFQQLNSGNWGGHVDA